MSENPAPEIPTSEEMHRIYHAELHRALTALATPIAEIAEKESIGRGTPVRIAHTILAHALIMLGMSIAKGANVPEEAVTDIIRMSEKMLESYLSGG